MGNGKEKVQRFIEKMGLKNKEFKDSVGSNQLP